MGNILVLFDSDTGHTEQMAHFIAQGAQGVSRQQVVVKSVDQASVDDIRWCDGIALGSPTHMGLMSWKMKRFWDEQARPVWGEIDGKIGCAFSSSGGWAGGGEIACMGLLTILMNFGFLVFGVTDYVSEKQTLHYGAVVAKAPRHTDEQAACIRLGERLGQWVAVHVDGEKAILGSINKGSV